MLSRYCKIPHLTGHKSFTYSPYSLHPPFGVFWLRWYSKYTTLPLHAPCYLWMVRDRYCNRTLGLTSISHCLPPLRGYLTKIAIHMKNRSFPETLGARRRERGGDFSARKILRAPGRSGSECKATLSYKTVALLTLSPASKVIIFTPCVARLAVRTSARRLLMICPLEESTSSSSWSVTR